MIEEVRRQVGELLNKDASGHGMDHVNRVLNLSLKFAEKENVNKEIVSLIALLHDADDYKLFGEESQKNLTNAKRIMENVNVSSDIQKKVCKSLKCIGYSKRLKGIVSETIEGKIVSDADMCDAIGAIGILRVHQFGLKIERPFFEKSVFPIDDTSYNYNMQKTASTINFIIEVLLKYKNLMLTNAGIKEAEERHKIIVDFLYHFFNEENVPEWIKYLDNYLNENKAYN